MRPRTIRRTTRQYFTFRGLLGSEGSQSASVAYAVTGTTTGIRRLFQENEENACSFGSQMMFAEAVFPSSE